MISRKLSATFACLTLFLAGCGKEEKKPEPAPTSSDPSPTPEPSFTKNQVEAALLDEKDLGADWTETEQLSAFRDGELRGCSESRIKLVGNPKKMSKKFGGPDFSFTGENYAQFAAIYENTDQATEAFKKMREVLSKCPPKKSVPFKRLPQKKFVYQHDDAWRTVEINIDGWQHIRGFEKSTYPESVSLINIIYYSIDYAQRGNIIFSSMLYQRTKPKSDGDSIFDKSKEVLLRQIENFNQLEN